MCNGNQLAIENGATAHGEGGVESGLDTGSRSDGLAIPVEDGVGYVGSEVGNGLHGASV